MYVQPLLCWNLGPFLLAFVQLHQAGGMSVLALLQKLQSDSDLALAQLQLVSWMDGCPASIHASETGSIHPVSEVYRQLL